MKLSTNPKASQRGFAFVMVLFFGALALLALAGVMQWSASSSQLNDRSNRLNKAIGAAEAATEKVLTSLSSDFRNYDETTVYSRLSTYSGRVPTTTESAEWANYSFSDALGHSSQTYVTRVSTNGFTPVSQYSGLQGYSWTYRIISNVRESAGLGQPIYAAVQQEVQLTTIPIFQFAVFYNGDMEYIGTAPMNINGPVHGNGNIYTGSSSALNFNGDVSVSGVIANTGGYGYSGTATTYNGNSTTNAASMTLPIGTNTSFAAVHQILDPPLSGEDPNSAMGRERYFNKAELVIQMTNTGPTAFVKTPGSSSGTTIPSAQLTNFLDTSKTFTDLREGKIVQSADFDVGKFNAWAATNTTIASVLGSTNTVPNIVYFADRRSLTSAQMGAIRMVNGATLSSRGLTIATPNPLYVKGVFNQPNSSYLGTTNTSNTKPASLICDAFTILSPNWSDLLSTVALGISASDTTINAAILTGTVPSSDPILKTGTYSGGVNNLPRLLEDWSGDTYTLNGSVICLFNSTNANKPFQFPGIYYRAPTRKIAFDSNFLNPNKLPPGTPALRTLIRSKWSTPPVNTTSYAGF